MAEPNWRRQIALLEAAWKAFEKAAAKAKGKTLSSGPRGGGRSVREDGRPRP